ncbi:nuclear transcription factor Y subunit A-7-like isoform X2 [Momordica charantia]|nr:nuclear transcription factor Y subunit A-7-like isoform X2 [Momordica charantia]
MMSSGTEYRNRPICDNLQTRNRSPNYTTDNSQSWWWHGGGHGGATTTTTTTMSKEDESNWAWPKGLVSSGPGPKTSIKQMQTTISPPQGGESAATPNKSRDASIMLPLMNNEHLASTSHSELVTLPMTATSYQYHDACNGGITMPPFGFQTLNSEYSKVAHGRMALPLAIAEEPVYVNAKQYHGILRRRQSRAKAEVENRINRSQKKPYLHESRHLHAMRRERGCGGRFVSKKKKVESSASMDDDENGSNISLGSEPMSNGSSCYEGSGLHLSAYI